MMTTSNGNRVSLSAGDWLKVILFILVQSAALIGVGVDMRERLAVVETQLKNREEGFAELREEINELRQELISLHNKPPANDNSGIVMQIRDRIKELRRVPAAQLRPNPRNWRTHNDAQRNALQGVLAEVGYAGALLVRELPDGSLELIDGHLRAETTPDMTVPVLVLDVNEEEAKLILATHDPLAGMAGVAAETLDSLLAEIHTDNPAVQAMWDSLTTAADGLLDESLEQPPKEAMIAPLFQVVVECGNEAEQQTVYERLIAEGLKCRVLTL